MRIVSTTCLPHTSLSGPFCRVTKEGVGVAIWEGGSSGIMCVPILTPLLNGRAFHLSEPLLLNEFKETCSRTGEMVPWIKHLLHSMMT